MANLAHLLIGNSLFLIGAILNQNENWKDLLLTQNSNIVISPLKKITFVSFILHLYLLLAQIHNQ